MYLWFAGHQACYRDVADRFDVQLNTLYNVISRISEYLLTMSNDVIRFPTQDEKVATSTYFHTKTGFPNVIGAIDGSHVQLNRPKNDPVSYINRKRYYSIQLQAICDHESRFIDVFIGFPGSCHDSRVFRESDVYPVLDELCNGDYVILGDSAYPLSTNVLTPFKDNGHLTPQQKRYNTTLSKCRIVIEHAFGRLKQRYRQLYHLKLKNMPRIVKFIHACCVLHNLGTIEEIEIIERNEPAVVEPNFGIENNEGGEENGTPAQQLRNRMVALLNRNP